MLISVYFYIAHKSSPTLPISLLSTDTKMDHAELLAGSIAFVYPKAGKSH